MALPRMTTMMRKTKWLTLGALLVAAPANAQPPPEANEPPTKPSPDAAPSADVAPAPAVTEDMLGEAGESCRARADCQRGLKCVQGTCRDPREGTSCNTSSACGTLKCIQNQCTNTLAPPAAAPPTGTSPSTPWPMDDTPRGTGWMGFTFGEGTHGFVGMSFVGGPTGILDTDDGDFDFVEPSWAWELHGGFVAGRFELGVHLSPVTYKMHDALPETQFSMLMTVGGFIPLSDTVSWPMRIGAGFVAVNLPTDEPVQPQFEAGLVGLAFHIGHLNIELEAPSFRSVVLADNDRVLFGWHFGAKTAYVF